MRSTRLPFANPQSRIGAIDPEHSTAAQLAPAVELSQPKTQRHPAHIHFTSNPKNNRRPTHIIFTPNPNISTEASTPGTSVDRNQNDLPVSSQLTNAANRQPPSHGKPPRLPQNMAEKILFSGPLEIAAKSKNKPISQLVYFDTFNAEILNLREFLAKGAAEEVAMVRQSLRLIAARQRNPAIALEMQRLIENPVPTIDDLKKTVLQNTSAVLEQYAGMSWEQRIHAEKAVCNRLEKEKPATRANLLVEVIVLALLSQEQGNFRISEYTDRILDLHRESTNSSHHEAMQEFAAHETQYEMWRNDMEQSMEKNLQNTRKFVAQHLLGKCSVAELDQIMSQCSEIIHQSAPLLEITLD